MFANATTLIFDVERYNIALKYCSRVSNAWTTIRDATTMDVVTYEKDRVNTPPPPRITTDHWTKAQRWHAKHLVLATTVVELTM